VAVADVCVHALAGFAPDSAEHERVAGRLREALAREPDRADLLVGLATVRNFQGRFDEAEAGYKAAVDKNPRHTTALNNLAWLLALKGGRGAEALDLVRRAAEAGGLESGLLDTRAVAYLSLWQSEATAKAIQDLEEVAAEAPAAVTYFHLAQAYLQARKRPEAGRAWKKAVELGLAPNALHPLERPAYQQLQRDLN
jgi:Tfp pilus assembly protein PilF